MIYTSARFRLNVLNFEVAVDATLIFLQFLFFLFLQIAFLFFPGNYPGKISRIFNATEMSNDYNN